MALNILSTDTLLEICKHVEYDRDIAHLLSSCMVWERCKQLVVSNRRIDIVSRVSHVLEMFHEDVYKNVAHDFEMDTALRAKHFDLFIEGYSELKLMRSFYAIEFYKSEIESLAAACPCDSVTFINSMRFIDTFEENRNVADMMKARAMAHMFQRYWSSAYDDEIVMLFENGATLQVKCVTGNLNGDAFAVDVQLRYHNLYYRLQRRLRDASDGLWINVLAEAMIEKTRSSLLWGKLKSINYVSTLAPTWRKGYFMLECLPQYKRALNIEM